MFLAGFFATALLLAGCTTAQVREAREGATGIEPHEAIAIIIDSYSSPNRINSSPDSPNETRAIENELGGCLSETIRKAHPTLRIVSPDEFRQAVFSYQFPEGEAQIQEYLALLVNQPAIRDRMAFLRIRYLISVGGATHQGTLEGGGFAAVAPGGGGFFGFWSADRQSRLKATVFDLKQAGTSRKLHAEASGRPWLAIVVIVPIGAPAFTESRACRDLGEAIAKFLANHETSESRGEPGQLDR